MSINPYKKVTSDAFQQMQLDAGVLLDEFNFASPFTAPADSHIIATTTGGINPVCEPQYEDLGEDVDNVPDNMLDFLKLTGWKCSLSFTSIKFNADNTKWALSAADEGDVPSGAPTGTKRIVPRAEFKMTDAKDIYAAFPMADGGIFVVKLKNAVSTGGLNIQSTKNGKGTNKVTLTGYVTASDQESMPMEFYHIPAELAHFTVTSAAGSSSGKTAITISGYTKPDGASYAYKVGDNAESVDAGMTITVGTGGYTSWDGSAEISATSGKVITVVAYTGTTTKTAIAEGHATVVAAT